mmetsp:Transcript_37601/g.96179  ORF Transcript_37601/g.96179 Transcript_37601/m.96179 type:complete len:224 (+) Transcript_37601:715-1386(+)
MYSFRVSRHCLESCCSCAAKLLCVFCLNSSSSSPPAPWPNVLTWWMDCSHTRICVAMAAEIASTSCSDPSPPRGAEPGSMCWRRRCCALASCASWSRISLMSSLALSAKSTHRGGRLAPCARAEGLSGSLPAAAFSKASLPGYCCPFFASLRFRRCAVRCLPKLCVRSRVTGLRFVSITGMVATSPATAAPGRGRRGRGRRPRRGRAGEERERKKRGGGACEP